jgi:hypothetical protein
VQLGPQIPGEAEVGHDPRDHLEVVTPGGDTQIEARRLVQVDRGLAANRIDAAQFTQVGELVGRVDRRRPHAGSLDLGAQSVLARDPIADALILGQRRDDLGDLGAEAVADLGDGQLGILDAVVKEGGGNRDVVGAEIGEQLRDLDRVREVRLTVGTQLPVVNQRGEVERAANRVRFAGDCSLCDGLTASAGGRRRRGWR